MAAACCSLQDNLDLVNKAGFLLLLLVMSLEPKLAQSYRVYFSLVITEGVGLAVWLSYIYLRDLRTETCSSQPCWTKEYLQITIHILYNDSFGTQVHNTVKPVLNNLNICM